MTNYLLFYLQLNQSIGKNDDDMMIEIGLTKNHKNKCVREDTQKDKVLSGRTTKRGGGRGLNPLNRFYHKGKNGRKNKNTKV